MRISRSGNNTSLVLYEIYTAVCGHLACYSLFCFVQRTFKLNYLVNIYTSKYQYISSLHTKLFVFIKAV